MLYAIVGGKACKSRLHSNRLEAQRVTLSEPADSAKSKMISYICICIQFIRAHVHAVAGEYSYVYVRVRIRTLQLHGLLGLQLLCSDRAA